MLDSLDRSQRATGHRPCSSLESSAYRGSLVSTSRNSIFWKQVPYSEFLSLQSRAAVVITDSGRIQEETAYLGVPCLTVRPNTERPITVTMGTNIVVGEDKDKLTLELQNVLTGKATKGAVPPLWDGHAGDRIAEILKQA